MKKLFLTILFLILTATAVLAIGTTTVTHTPVGETIIVTITTTGDSSTGAFVPAIFDSTANNISIYNSIRGKYLESARTTIDAVTAPTSNYDIYILDANVSSTSEHILTTPTLAKGSDVSAVAYAAFCYVINGAAYSILVNTVGIDPGNDIIPQSKYGAVAYDIDAAGTITVAEAAANATGYDSAALAIAGVPAVTSAKARMGYVTATKSDEAFTFGTTELGVANSTCAYLNTVPAYDIAAGRLVNRSATANEQVWMNDADGSPEYPFITDPCMICLVNNAVPSAAVTLKLIFRD